MTNGAVSLTHPVPPTDPAWTLYGKPLPIASPLGVPSSPGNPAAVIPVQKIKGPVLLLVGADDQLWPAPLYAQAIMTRLRQYDGHYTHLDLVFPGAGHAVGAAFHDLGTVSFTTHGRNTQPGRNAFRQLSGGDNGLARRTRVPAPPPLSGTRCTSSRPILRMAFGEICESVPGAGT